jgi:lauroyl/myristoyl acyltransferase
MRGPVNRLLERASHDPALDILGSASIASTARPGPAAVPAIDRKDLGLLGLLPVLAAIAWMLPERAWPQLANQLAGLRLQLRGQRAADEIVRIEAIVGDRLPGFSAAACWRAHLANNYLAWLQLLRCHRDRGWHPMLRLEGQARLDAALAAGKGGILWVLPLAFSDLITKLALHEAGYAVSHLSRDTHGFSTSRFGRRLINPIQTSVERRYLAERLVMSDDNTVGPLRELAQRLKSNRLISITLTPGGQRLRSMPFLDGHLPVAIGALALSWQTGAPVLPVFTLREAQGSFVTTVEEPLPLDRGRSRDLAMDGALDACAERLEAAVLKSLDQFALPYVATTRDTD